MTEKCKPEDPRRCQSVTKNGQCNYLSVEGSEHCFFHNGNQRGGNQLEQKRKDRYLIDQQDVRQSYERHNDDANYLGLKDEISLVTAILEKRINSIKTDADCVMGVGHIALLTQRLESMKINLIKIQSSMGLVLGKDELRILARQMAQILDEELDGLPDKSERMDRIVERLFSVIENAGREDD